MRSWDQLEHDCGRCHRCPLGDTRTNPVFGDGAKNADILIVGEAPGEQEDLSGTPFVGRAGRLLNTLLEGVGLSRNDVYIANILKCRPPENRDPLPAEEDACLPYLEEQIALLSPKVIVCLGRIAASRLVKKDFRITREHGVWFERNGVPITAIYHPAYLLRDPRKRPEAEQDLALICEKIKELV